MNGRGALFAVQLLLAVPVALAQGIYKWVDAQGEVHYGERPPVGTPASEVVLKDSAPAAPVSQQDRQENTRRILQTFEEERAQKQEEEAKAAKESEQRKKRCITARDHLRRMEEASYLYDLNKKGERQVMNEADRAAAHKRGQEEVAKYCK